MDPRLSKELMKYLAACVLLVGWVSPALANTFRLECLDSDDGKTRLAATRSVTINRVNGKYFAYTGNSARKDGQCKRVP